MRVITGIARGHRLIAPEGLDVRPTTDKVKEAIFSSIKFEIEGAYVLDLFAGSGQIRSGSCFLCWKMGGKSDIIMIWDIIRKQGRRRCGKSE